ncbi:1,4-dihydroxy-2-naphthoate octaprenyltransferase [uncultured Dokdonia sp.]|uniref:1,4-dihydroxy-2-naphthoate octaprenyltransferase n=1 Tax=uncultured Dokdonia sp. TaxID=575653 RepID=UPI0026105071|nr:1,4-dihydroxy-2-naphthoate octaprenyltransferase [uncultured Dokdonia sp.]
MSSLKAWIQAARLRTLPLSISGILVGGGMAVRTGFFDWRICVCALLATLGFQILSNYANDYGDGVKGTDNEDRVGPMRAMQSGLLTASDLRKGIIVTSIITIIVVIYLIYIAFGADQLVLSLVFMFLGISAIVSAIKYTVGKSAYGYKGLGDVFVFLFFGLVAVMGSYFLYAQQLPLVHFLGAITIGLLSTTVLHLNNMRDRVQDQKVGKNTLAVMLGQHGALRYHNILFGCSILSWLGYLLLSHAEPILFMSCLAFLPLLAHFIKVQKTKNHILLDPQLKVVALSTFLLSVLFFTIAYVTI